MLPKRNSTDEIGVRAAFARKIARRAGSKAKRLFSHPRRLTAQVKSSPQDLVSEADRSVEAYLRHQISSHFPDDAIIGEENAPTDGRSTFKWVIDPIDGTMAFLTGQPNWTVSIAVLEGDELVAGVVFAPVLKEIYHAMRGRAPGSMAGSSLCGTTGRSPRSPLASARRNARTPIRPESS